MPAVARRDVDRRLQFVLKELLDADEVQRVETAARVVVDEEIDVAARFRLAMRSRT
jgi:hypothetical protein